MKAYKNEVYVHTYNGQPAVFVTARTDDRADDKLAAGMPDYFDMVGSLVYKEKIVTADGMSKDAAEYGRAYLIAYYERMGYKILNRKTYKTVEVAAV